MNKPQPNRYRSIWISDTHLGTKNAKAEFLLDFLRHNETHFLYLVGDIVDGWQLRKSWYWPQAHNDVIQKILRKARKGTKVTVVPGNHDEFLFNYTNFDFGGISIVPQAVHQMMDGHRFLVTHGHEFDGVLQYAKWLARLGDEAYEWALSLNRWFNIVRRQLGYPYWSLSAYLKGKVKNAVNFISDFESALIEEAKRKNVQGVICGHIHHAEIHKIGEMTYCNTGDWVESCTALVETWDGKLEIVRWPFIQQDDSVQLTPLDKIHSEIKYKR